MPSLSGSIVWLYHEFGLSAIHETGRNAYLIILARALRMFAYGTTFILALFFAELGFEDYQIGLFFTLTLLGDVLLGTFLTLVADRVGRRKCLLAGSGLMVLSGLVFSYFENFAILLIAAVCGVISTTGGDFGPFRSIEESMLSHLTTPRTRADVLAWYVTTSTLGSAVGSELSGRLIHGLQRLPGWTLNDVYHALFLLYSAMGVVNAMLALLLTDACEIQKTRTAGYTTIRQNEEGNGGIELEGADHVETLQDEPLTNGAGHKAGWIKRSVGWLGESLSQISRSTLRVIWKLWVLLALDSVADGMVPYSLTNYYIDEKFHPAKSTLGDAQSAAYLLGAIGTVFSGPLARKIGLINTMVFTHIPSSTAVLAFPAPSSLWLTILLLFLRTGPNGMDQAPRAAFIAAVVKPEERTAVMGITGLARTLAAVAGPTITGILAGNQRFWIAFVAAGTCRLVYDVGLWVLFINTPLDQYESSDVQESLTDEETFTLDSPTDEGDDSDMGELEMMRAVQTGKAAWEEIESHERAGSSSLLPGPASRVRRRSRSPLPDRQPTK